MFNYTAVCYICSEKSCRNSPGDKIYLKPLRLVGKSEGIHLAFL